MQDAIPYQFLANAVLLLHVAIVLFVVLGLVLIVVGNLRAWLWVNAMWFRAIHLATIGIVVLEAAFGWTCPLTTLEIWLRARAQSATYSGSFIAHWLQAMLFWSAPPWVFTMAYSVFGFAVAAAWWRFPPRLSRLR